MATSQAQIGGSAAHAPSRPIARHGSGRRVLRDATLLLASLAFAAVTTNDVVGTLQIGWVACYGVLFLLVDSLLRSSPQPMKVSVVNDVRDVLLSASVAAMATLSLRVLATDSATATSETLGVWGFSLVVLVSGAIASSLLVVRSRRARADAKPTLIIGAGTVGHLLARRLLERPDLGLRPVGFLDKDPFPLNGAGTGIRCSEQAGIWTTSWPATRSGTWSWRSRPHPTTCCFGRCAGVTSWISQCRSSPPVREDDGEGERRPPRRPPPDLHPPGRPKGLEVPAEVRTRTGDGRGPPRHPPSAARSVDGSVWLSLGRPILYRQRRIGLDGQEFDILKFRSMRSAPDDECADLNLRPDIAPGGINGTERRTKFGKFIRATSIDELPQLINVLRGEMSLVGPRPERPEFSEIFHQQIHRYGERLRVKSGITGWAQVNGLRGQTSLSERIELDNHYIENWSFLLDLKILLLTVRAVLRFNAD